eukprot:360291-Chlamydomonas_euryale.AAC.11
MFCTQRGASHVQSVRCTNGEGCQKPACCPADVSRARAPCPPRDCPHGDLPCHLAMMFVTTQTLETW